MEEIFGFDQASCLGTLQGLKGPLFLPTMVDVP